MSSLLFDETNAPGRDVFRPFGGAEPAFGCRLEAMVRLLAAVYQGARMFVPRSFP
jgi:hypothetical protein